jgi:hypothetical protein
MIFGDVKAVARRRLRGARGDKGVGIVTSLPPGIAPPSRIESAAMPVRQLKLVKLQTAMRRPAFAGNPYHMQDVGASRARR